MTHAMTRLRERYRPGNPGLAMARIAKEIAAGKGKLVRPLAGGRTLWIVYAAGRHVRVVWDEMARLVITVLPPKPRKQREVPA